MSPLFNFENKDLHSAFYCSPSSSFSSSHSLTFAPSAVVHDGSCSRCLLLSLFTPFFNRFTPPTYRTPLPYPLLQGDQYEQLDNIVDKGPPPPPPPLGGTTVTGTVRPPTVPREYCNIPKPTHYNPLNKHTGPVVTVI